MALCASWLVLIAGLVMISALILGPDQDRAELAVAQTRMLESRLDWWERKAEAHKRFLAALRVDDPIVLEHLALTELNRIVRGKKLYDETVSFRSPRPMVLGHIGDWLDQAAGPIDTSEVNPPREGWLDSLAPEKRLGLMIAGGLFVVAGILWNPRSEDQSEAVSA